MNPIEEKAKRILESFEKNVTQVDQLINFDRLVVGLAIKTLENLEEKLKRHHKLDNPHLSANAALIQLRGIRENESLRPGYQIMLNSCLVLLVAYFASAIGDLFEECLPLVLGRKDLKELGKEEIKFTLAELQSMNFNLKENIGHQIALKGDFTFQDMQSIAKAFFKYYKIDILQDQTVNNIIAAQACRHVIVHSDGKVNEKLLRQVAKAVPRDLKTELELKIQIQFDSAELLIVINSMIKYLKALIQKVVEAGEQNIAVSS